ncbi:MAG: exodeoxyribonuclease VII large subunit [Alphaproteobacteria bacterium]|nr:MAG: exodeoxyribonuclease VII large subunit [Alphaproteobacteria bacterium]
MRGLARRSPSCSIAHERGNLAKTTNRTCSQEIRPVPPTAHSNIREYTVSELSFALKRTVEEAYEYVRVRGEISGFKRAASGHMYMALKDADAVLDAVCWRGMASRLEVKPEDGLEVIATGKLTTYPGRSKYQLVIQSLEPAGVGALMALLEERKKKLAAEGLFAPERKRPIPFLPRVVGVITSPTGAVIRDILHRLSDRFPRDVLVWPVVVQGEGAAEQVAAAIRGFNALPVQGDIARPDVLIVARGGGSLEDLWAFNEEIVVRAAADSTIPLISAVGHETDTTLIDYVADLRAPTPTAAAEKAVPVRSELISRVETLGSRLDGARRRLVDDRRQRVAGLARGLPSPREILALPQQCVDDLGERLPRALVTTVERARARLDRLAGQMTPLALEREIERRRDRLRELGERARRELRAVRDDRVAGLKHLTRMLRPDLLVRDVRHMGERVEGLAERLNRSYMLKVDRWRDALAAQVRLMESLSYGQVLARGFALVRDAAGQPVTRAAGAVAGADWEVEFHDGRVPVEVKGADSAGDRLTRPRAKRNSTDDGDRQGKLL